MQASNELETSVLDHIFTDGSWTPAATPYCCLCTATPTDVDLAGTISEATYTEYARVAVAAAVWDSAVAGNPSYKDNGSAITFAQNQSGPSNTIKAFAIVSSGPSSGTTGDLYFWGPLWTGVVWAVGTSVDDYWYAPGHGFSNDDKVVLDAETVPGGFARDTEYYVVNATASERFQLAASQGGSAIAISSSGVVRVGESQWLTVGVNVTPEFAASQCIVRMQ